MSISCANCTSPKATPAIQKYQAAEKTEVKPVEKAPAKPVEAKHDRVEVSSEGKAKLAAESTAAKEQASDKQVAQK